MVGKQEVIIGRSLPGDFVQGVSGKSRRDEDETEPHALPPGKSGRALAIAGAIGRLSTACRLKNALTPHVCALSKGISVVLDFPGNTKTQRAWFRDLIARANVEHELHFVDASDALCKSQLRDRSEGLPAGTPWTRDADFEAINAYFQPPTEDERFNVIRHQRV